MTNVSTNAFATSSVTAQVEGGVTTLAEGSSRNLEFTGSFSSTTLAGVYKLKVDSITWTPTGGSAVTQSAGFEALDSSTFSY
jgi:hypothetical protein